MAGEFVEVTCTSSGQTRRFAAGTNAEFAVSLINGKLKKTEPVALHIEAVKHGEESIAFGPNSIIVNFGNGWKLRTAISSDMARTKNTGRCVPTTLHHAHVSRQPRTASLGKRKAKKHTALSSQPPPPPPPHHRAPPSALAAPATSSATAPPPPPPPAASSPLAAAIPSVVVALSASLAPLPLPASSPSPPAPSSAPSPPAPSSAPSPPATVAAPSPPPSSNSSSGSSSNSLKEAPNTDEDDSTPSKEQVGDFGNEPRDKDNPENVTDVLGDDVPDEEDEIDDPQDQSLLVSYHDHVARQIWQGNDLGVLTRCTSRRWALPLLDELPAQVRDIVEHSGLAPLVGLSYEQVDRRLLSSFAERWFSDTNTFHLPVGEMTITLDDVSSLLHIPVVGKFIHWTKPKQHEGVQLMRDLLGFTKSEALEEARKTRGGSVRFLILKDKYDAHVAAGRHEFAARCYLLHMVGSTLFLDKSLTYIGCQYILPFEDLNGIREYAWGACALAHLYDELADASKASKKQLGGYMTLLQAWIKEHFPSIGCAIPRDDYLEQMPRVLKWEYGVASYNMGYHYRSHLESLRVDQVRWQPYDPDHRLVRQFEEVSMFSGYLRLGYLKVPYLPERVLRQFGYVQTIPPAPRVAPAKWEEIDAEFATWTMHVLDDARRGQRVKYHGEYSTDYIDWLHRFSHPYLLSTSSRVENPFTINHRYRDRIRQIIELVHPMQTTNVVDRQAIQQILDLCDRPIIEDAPIGVKEGKADRGGRAHRGGRADKGGRTKRGGRAEHGGEGQGSEGRRVRGRVQ